MKRSILLLSVLPFAALRLSGADSAQINFTSPFGEIGKTSTGSTFTTGFTFSLGSFGSFVPTGYNLPSWYPNFSAFNPAYDTVLQNRSATWDDSFFSQYSQTATLTSNAAPFATTNQGYVWGYDNPSLVNGNQWILLTNSNWKFPGIAAVPPVVTWDASDSGTSAIIGFRSSAAVETGADPYLQSAAVSPNVVLPTLTLASLDVTAAGTISQTGSLTLSGAGSFKTLNDTGGAITLNLDGNSFGSVSLQVRNAADTADANAAINLHSGAALSLASIRTGGNLTLASNNHAITQTGAIVVGGTSGITAGAAAITLTHSGNHFTGTLTLGNSGANNVSVTDSGALRLGASTIGGALTIAAGGSITLGGGTISSGGAQNFNSAVLLAGATTLTSTGNGALNFTSTLDDGQVLALNTGGTTTLGGAVGNTTPLTSLTTDAGGTTAVNGGLVKTTGAQTYHDPVTLGANTVFQSVANGPISFFENLLGNGFSAQLESGGDGNFNSASNLSSLTKSGSGTMTFTGQSSYTGPTIVSAGTLALGRSNALAATSPLTLGGGTFATGGFSQTLGALTLAASSAINFGSGASALVFANSSTQSWTAPLLILNYTVSVDSLRFGTSAFGLTNAQLSLLNFNGLAAQIDANGFVTPSAIPEPSTYAIIAGAGALGFAIFRRKRRMA